MIQEKLNLFFKTMNEQKTIDETSLLFPIFDELAEDARRITMEMNNTYHTQEELRNLFSELTGKPIDASCRFFPPFYTDCGKNISLGKKVFINMNCCFQDQGGIEIGDNVLIGHHVVLATLQHDLAPSRRQNLTPKKIVIGNNVWIGSNVTILPGVKIGDGAIVGAGSVVTHDVEKNAVVAGNPAKVLKYCVEEPIGTRTGKAKEIFELAQTMTEDDFLKTYIPDEIDQVIFNYLSAYDEVELKNDVLGFLLIMLEGHTYEEILERIQALTDEGIFYQIHENLLNTHLEFLEK